MTLGKYIASNNNTISTKSSIRSIIRIIFIIRIINFTPGKYLQPNPKPQTSEFLAIQFVWDHRPSKPLWLHGRLTGQPTEPPNPNVHKPKTLCDKVIDALGTWNYGNILQFMRVVSASNLVLFSPNLKQQTKTKEALPFPVPTTRAGRFWENWLHQTWDIWTFGYFIHFRCSVCDFAIFAILLQNFDNLGTQFCYAFEWLHLGVWVISHQCSTYKYPALSTTLFLKALNLKPLSCRFWEKVIDKRFIAKFYVIVSPGEKCVFSIKSYLKTLFWGLSITADTFGRPFIT